MVFSQDESIILACWYSSEYNVDNALDNLGEVIKKHWNCWKGKYYVYIKICKKIGFVIWSSESFKLLLNKNRYLKLHNNLFKHFHVEIIEQKKSWATKMTSSRWLYVIIFCKIFFKNKFFYCNSYTILFDCKLSLNS